MLRLRRRRINGFGGEALWRRRGRSPAGYPSDRIFLNPDCGFGIFSSRPMNTWGRATAKVSAMVAAARQLRGSNS